MQLKGAEIMGVSHKEEAIFYQGKITFACVTHALHFNLAPLAEGTLSQGDIYVICM